MGVAVLGFAGVMLVIFVFVVALVWAITKVTQDRRPADEQLQSRFARGEITEGEYLRNLAILQHGADFVLEADREPALRRADG